MMKGQSPPATRRAGVAAVLSAIRPAAFLEQGPWGGGISAYNNSTCP